MITKEEFHAAYDIWENSIIKCTNSVADMLWCEYDKEGVPLNVDYGILDELIKCGFNDSDVIMSTLKFIYHDSQFLDKDASLYAHADAAPLNLSFVYDQDGFESIIQKQAQIYNILSFLGWLTKLSLWGEGGGRGCFSQISA